MVFAYRLLSGLIGGACASYFLGVGTAAIMQRAAYPLLMRYTFSVSGYVAIAVGLGWIALALSVFAFTVLRPWPHVSKFGTGLSLIGLLTFLMLESTATLMQIAKVYF